MMKKGVYSVFILFIAIIMIILFVSACDSSKGKSDKLIIDGYRDNGSFTLPIKVRRIQYYDFPHKQLFKYNGNIDSIYKTVKSKTDYKVVRHNDAIIIKDDSGTNIGYCAIYSINNNKKYNYVFTNMACYFKDSETNNSVRYRTVLPLHLMKDKMIGEIEMDGNTEYKYLGTMDELISFYADVGFTVERMDNTLFIEDSASIEQYDTLEYLLIRFKIHFINERIVFERG